MSQAQLIHRLNSFTATTNYGKLLKDEFDVELPNGLQYQKEYLYKYLLQDKYTGIQFDLESAMKKVAAFITKYPEVLAKYEDEPTEINEVGEVKKTKDETSISTRGHFSGLHSGYYVVFNDTRKARKFVAYNGKERLFSKETMELAKAAITKKFGAVDIKEI